MKIRDSSLQSLRAGGLGAWMLAGLEGLEGVAARWEEGIGRNPRTLELEELGGFKGASDGVTSL